MISRRKLYFGITIIICLLMITMSLDFGPSNDEIYQVPYGKQALNYYTSFTVNDSVLDYKPEPLMKNYGALIDMLPEAISRVIGSDLMTTRHMAIALISFFYIFFGGLIAKRIAGWNAAFIAIALLVILPRIFGEAMNNPKDPPFAATYLISIYAFMSFLDSLPNPNRRNYIILFIGILSTMLVRVSGLLAVFYFGLFLLIELYRIYKVSDKEVHYSKLIRNITITGLGGYFASIFFWPSMMNNPIMQPIDALKMLSQYPVVLRDLWEGQYVMSNTIPWYYNPKYFLISNPEITVLGIFIGIVLLKRICQTYNSRRIAFLLFASLFPLIYIIYNKTALLTGWRHSYFIFVPLVIFSAIAFAYILDHMAKTKLKKGALIGFIAIGLLLPLSYMFGNYPYFYTYFNHAFGGTKKALGNYELDYYSHSEKPATDWLIENLPDFKHKVIASNNPFAINEIFKTNQIDKVVNYVRYRERYDTDWDYGIFTQSYIDAEYLRNDLFPPKGTIKTIDAGGVPICAIIKREDKNDFMGKRALDSQNYPRAIELLTKSLNYDPNNEIAWTNLGFAQLNSGRADQAVESLSNALKVTPENLSAQNYLAYAYLQTGNIAYAQSVLMRMLEVNPNMPDPYRLLGQIYQQQGNTQMAQQYNNAYQQIMTQLRGR